MKRVNRQGLKYKMLSKKYSTEYIEKNLCNSCDFNYEFYGFLVSVLMGLFGMGCFLFGILYPIAFFAGFNFFPQAIFVSGTIYFITGVILFVMFILWLTGKFDFTNNIVYKSVKSFKEKHCKIYKVEG